MFTYSHLLCLSASSCSSQWTMSSKLCWQNKNGQTIDGSQQRTCLEQGRLISESFLLDVFLLDRSSDPLFTPLSQALPHIFKWQLSRYYLNGDWPDLWAGSHLTLSQASVLASLEMRLGLRFAPGKKKPAVPCQKWSWRIFTMLFVFLLELLYNISLFEHCHNST